MYCYCFEQFKEIQFGIQNINFGQEKGAHPCADMTTVLSISNAVLIGMSILISGVNAVLRIVLGRMAVHEGKHSITD